MGDIPSPQLPQKPQGGEQAEGLAATEEFPVVESQPLPPSKLPDRNRRQWMIWLVLLVISIVAAYGYRESWRNSRVGHWLGLQTKQSPISQSADVYYCPMHPQYKSPKPGTCPICNMTLVKAETPNPEVSGTTGERKILYWQDPMNPANRSDKPGKAPDGMDLVPVYAEEGSQPQMPPGTVKISAAKQQLIGVTYGEVTSDSLTHTIRTVGRVAYDETKITRIHTKIDGWLDKVFVDFTGKLVTKGQPLISLYSPDLVSTQQEYLLALKAKNYLGQSEYKEIATSTNSLFESSRKRLLLWDIPEEEIQQIEKRGEPMRTLTLYAPSDGFVLAKNAYERQRVTPETELYTIADLSNIWVLADIYEYEIPSVKLGQSTTVTFSAFPGETFRGKITYIYPQLDNMTRTLKVRIELPNSGFKIKPDMYANIELQIGYGEQLSIPEEAVLDSGSEQTVFVVLEGGYFEPRNVQLGAKVGNRFIILNGLNVGEKIVTSGNFLIDSESRLKSATSSMAGMNHGTQPANKAGASQNPTGSTSIPGMDHSQHKTSEPQTDKKTTDHSGHKSQ